MATIRLAYDQRAYVPIHGMSRAAFIAAQNVGIQATLSRGPQCYSKEANLLFTGVNNGWDIIFSGKSVPNGWASARCDAWGRGVVYWSTNANVLAQWNTWPYEKLQWMISNVVGHEVGHILLATTNQTVGIPLTSAMRTRLRGHYGNPVMRAEFEMGEVASSGSQSAWDRLRGAVLPYSHVLTFEEFERAHKFDDL